MRKLNKELAGYVGQKLRTAREEAGLSRTEVATQLGMSYHGYAYYERGERLLHLEFLLQLPHIFGKPMTYFLPRNGSMTGDEWEEATSDPALQQVVRAWPHLPQPARDSIQNLALILTNR